MKHSFSQNYLGFLAFFLFLVACSGAKQKSGIRVQFDGLSNKDSVILAAYLGERLYPKDTFMPDKSGVLHIEDIAKYEKGLYALVVNNKVDSTRNTMLDIIITGEPFVNLHTKAGKENSPQTTEVLASEENKIFYQYLTYIEGQKKEIARLEEENKKEELSPEDKTALETQIKEVHKAVQKEQERLAGGPLYVNKMLSLSFENEIPLAPEEAKDKNLWQHEYYKEHYWDGVDLQDLTLGNNSLFEKKFATYFTQVLPQNAETLEPEIKAFMHKIPENTSLYRLALLTLLSKFQYPTTVCLDKVFVFLVEEYVKAGKAFWLNKDMTAKIIEHAQDLKNVLCGAIAPDIKLVEPNLTQWTSLYSIKADYTVLAFWSSECGHCIREMPVLAEKMKQYPANKVKVFAVEVDVDTDKWIAFLKKQPEMSRTFINVSDTKDTRDNPLNYINSGKTDLNSLNFRKVYGIYATPTFILLDKEKRILYKNLTVDSLDALLGNLLSLSKK